MSTNSYIGILNENGTVSYIYCHWDGHPSSNGRILLNSYNTPEAARALISLGDLSSLGETLGEKQSFQNPVPGTCVVYGRDRGETHVSTKTTYLHDPDFTQGQPFVYLFRNGVWEYKRGRAIAFGPLTENDCKD